MKKLFLLVALLAMMLMIATPALAREMPDFSSATPLPSPYTEYEITNDGFLIYEGDIVLECESLRFAPDMRAYESYEPEVRSELRENDKQEYQAKVEACTEVGFPPKGSGASDMVTLQTPLTKTGGIPSFVVPVALLLGSGLLFRVAVHRMGP
jgi:hypothetical protein